jgi:molybdate transport system substrate-binding protein
MKTRILAAVAGIVVTFLLGSVPTHSAELKVICAVGFQPTMEELRPKFELATGHKLTMEYETIGLALKRLQKGDTADVILLPRQGIDSIVKDGKATAGNVTEIARGGMGMAVRKGAPKPDISSIESFKRALLTARSINISDPARGGIATPHILKVFERLGIAEEVKAKLVYAKVPGAAGIAREVVNGEAEIALNQLQEFVPVSGIEIVGPFPGDLQLTTVFSAVIMGSATNADIAKALITFLRTPEAAKVIRAKGLEPATP